MKIISVNQISQKKTFEPYAAQPSSEPYAAQPFSGIVKYTPALSAALAERHVFLVYKSFPHQRAADTPGIIMST